MNHFVAKLPLCLTPLYLTVAAFWLLPAVAANADLIVTGSTTTTISAGGVDIVDFYITASSGTSYQLGSFQIQLQASETFSPTPDGVNLQFTTSQPAVYDQANYVFAGSSGYQDNSFPFWGSPFSTVTASDSIVGEDVNDSALGYTTITSATKYLLAQVEVQAAPLQPPLDVYSISLTPASGSSNTATTYFNDVNGNGIAFSNTQPGVVSAEAASGSVVPEPSTFLLAGIGMLGGVLYSWRSRKHARRRMVDEWTL